MNEWAKRHQQIVTNSSASFITDGLSFTFLFFTTVSFSGAVSIGGPKSNRRPKTLIPGWIADAARCRRNANSRARRSVRFAAPWAADAAWNQIQIKLGQLGHLGLVAVGVSTRHTHITLTLFVLGIPVLVDGVTVGCRRLSRFRTAAPTTASLVASGKSEIWILNEY